jgi:hypothetical protein
MTSPVGYGHLRLVQPTAKMAQVKCAQPVQFGSNPDEDTLPPVQEQSVQSSRSFLGRCKDGVVNALFSKPKGILGYSELALDILGLAGNFFLPVLSLGLMIPGLIPKAIRFVSGFRNGAGGEASEETEMVQAATGKDLANAVKDAIPGGQAIPIKKD